MANTASDHNYTLFISRPRTVEAAIYHKSWIRQCLSVCVCLSWPEYNSVTGSPICNNLLSDKDHCLLQDFVDMVTSIWLCPDVYNIIKVKHILASGQHCWATKVCQTDNHWFQMWLALAKYFCIVLTWDCRLKVKVNVGRYFYFQEKTSKVNQQLRLKVLLTKVKSKCLARSYSMYRLSRDFTSRTLHTSIMTTFPLHLKLCKYMSKL